MSSGVHSETRAADAGRTTTFYREVFDWQVTAWAGPPTAETLRATAAA